MPVSYEETLRVIQGAQERARQIGIRITAVVVDEGGLLQALGRMDGAPPLSAQRRGDHRRRRLFHGVRRRWDKTLGPPGTTPRATLTEAG